MTPRTMFVYVLTNSKINPVLYTGVTNNLLRRITEHKQNTIEGFTKRYHLHTLVYYEVIEGQQQAIIREKQIKNMSRKEKLALIRNCNPKLQDLYFQLKKTLL